METKIVPLKVTDLSNGLKFQHLMRSTPIKEWLNDQNLASRLSGTLRKNSRLGFKYLSQLEHEAICQVLGYGFESMQSSYITFNDPVTEGDCHALTEVGWHFDRLLHIHPFDEDRFELKYINIQDINGNIERQGVGIIVRETSIQWIRSGTLVFSLLAEYNSKDKKWSECINPF